MIRLTIVVAQEHVAVANQLALCLGYGVEDGQTFGPALWQDGQGMLYALASGMVEESFLTNAFSPLSPPNWSVDLAAARQAQAMVVLCDPEAPCQASPDCILAMMLEVDQALALLGLQAVV